MATIILDACAVIAFFRNEGSAGVVDRYLSDRQNHCLIHCVNLCEVYYDFYRCGGEAVAIGIVDTTSRGKLSIGFNDRFLATGRSIQGNDRSDCVSGLFCFDLSPSRKGNLSHFRS